MIFDRTLRVIVRLNYHGFRCRSIHTDLKILYFGNDNFSINSLQKLHNENFTKLSVVTSFKARNNPVKVYAHRNQLECRDWVDFKRSSVDICKEYDLGVVVSFGHLIPESIINGFKLGMLNVHASLLPKYRGASPIIHAIRNGDKETGVSIMRIEPKKFDIGDVLAVQKIKIYDHMLMPELHDQLAELGADLLIKCIRNLDHCKPVKQDESKSSYAPKIDNEYCKVRWDIMTSVDIFNLYRSIYGFKNILMNMNGIGEIKIVELSKFDKNLTHETSEIDTSKFKAGDIVFHKKFQKLLAYCLDSNFIEIKKLTLVDKKKAMSGIDLNNGFLKKLKLCSQV